MALQKPHTNDRKANEIKCQFWRQQPARNVNYFSVANKYFSNLLKKYHADNKQHKERTQAIDYVFI